MSNILETMKDRRSIRKFTQEPISDQMVNSLLESVQCAQSWNNSQCWELVLVEDKIMKKSIQEAVPPQNPAFNAVVEAPLLIVLCAKLGLSGQIGESIISKPGDWFMFDAGIATQNLCNTAHDLGLGTVVVGWMDYDKIKNLIDLPDGYEVVALLPVGHPGHKGSSPKRKSIQDFVHKDRFGTTLCS